MAETAATCNNGLDDDCDGFIDAADSDCGAFYPPPNPPPPTVTQPPQAAGLPLKYHVKLSHSWLHDTVHFRCLKYRDSHRTCATQ